MPTGWLGWGGSDHNVPPDPRDNQRFTHGPGKRKRKPRRKARR